MSHETTFPDADLVNAPNGWTTTPPGVDHEWLMPYGQVGIVAPEPPADPADIPVPDAYWPLATESPAGYTPDEVGSANIALGDATLPATGSADQFNEANHLIYDIGGGGGTAAGISPAPAALQPSTSFCVSLWINTSAAPTLWQNAFYLTADGSTVLQVLVAPTYISCFYGATQVSYGFLEWQGDWNHILFYGGDGFCQMFVDGVLVGSASPSALHTGTAYILYSYLDIPMVELAWWKNPEWDTDDIAEYAATIFNNGAGSEYRAVGGWALLTDTADDPTLYYAMEDETLPLDTGAASRSLNLDDVIYNHDVVGGIHNHYMVRSGGSMVMRATYNTGATYLNAYTVWAGWVKLQSGVSPQSVVASKYSGSSTYMSYVNLQHNVPRDDAWHFVVITWATAVGGVQHGHISVDGGTPEHVSSYTVNPGSMACPYFHMLDFPYGFDEWAFIYDALRPVRRHRAMRWAKYIYNDGTGRFWNGSIWA